MIKLKVFKNDETVIEHDACKILAYINDFNDIAILKSMNWETTGKKDFLTGKTGGWIAIIAEPLSEADADQAINEYKDLGYYI
jgi:hypothetical protein